MKILPTTLARWPILSWIIFLTSLASVAHGQPQAVAISDGTWQGVTPCVGRSQRFYPIEMKIKANGEGGILSISYDTDHKRNNRFRDRHHKIYRSDEVRGPAVSYSYADDKGLNPRNMLFIKGPTTIYLWTGKPTFFSARCQDAILVPNDPQLFPNIPTHNDLCYRVQIWSGTAPQTSQKIEQIAARIEIPDYDKGIALLASQFSDPFFQNSFNRKFGDFTNDEIRRFIYHLRDCARYSDRAISISRELVWFFGESLIAKWQRMYPLAVNMNIDRKYNKYYAFERPLPSNFERDRTSILRNIRNTKQNKHEIDGALEELFRLPESPDLHRAISDFLTEYSQPLMFLDIEYAAEVFDLVSNRREMLRASEALATRFRLSEFPKLPPPNLGVDELLTDDGLLKPLTDQEIRELEKNVEHDF